jgi:hypothetical protein
MFSPYKVVMNPQGDGDQADQARSTQRDGPDSTLCPRGFGSDYFPNSYPPILLFWFKG